MKGIVMNVEDVEAFEYGEGVRVTFELNGNKIGILLDGELMKTLEEADICIPVVEDKRATAQLEKMIKRYNLKEYKISRGGN